MVRARSWFAFGTDGESMTATFTREQHRYLQMLLMELKKKGLVVDEDLHTATQQALDDARKKQ